MSRRLSRIQKAPIVWVPKPQPWVRDRDHLDWVGLLPCLACGRWGCSVAAHVRLYGDGAGARKPSDPKTVPLCGFPKQIEPTGCHEIQGVKGEQTFWAGLMAMGISDPWSVALHLWRISGDTEKGYRAIAHARPGLITAAWAA